jgi:hypothetical protein
VKFAKVSSVAQEKLIALCGGGVVKDCATRWNSILFVLHCLLFICMSLDTVLKHHSLTNTEWERSEYATSFSPFQGTDGCSADRHCLYLVFFLPFLFVCWLLYGPSTSRSYRANTRW